MDRDDQVKRADQAKRLLSDPLWTEAWETYRLVLFSKIESAKSDEGTLRGKMMLGVANDVRKFFEGLINTGKSAANDIKVEEAEKKRRWPFAA